MREIKFRAWDKWQKEWMYFTIGQVWGQDLKERYLAFCINGEKFYEFTGLKDKKGKEIYEGDILQWCDTTNVKDRWEVKETNGGWYPFIENMTTDKPFRYEVIGNIYENSELLEGGKR